LRETLLLDFVETTVERQEVNNSNEESFECLKQRTEEEIKFSQQLIEYFPNKDFLVKFCQHREEEYEAILENYEERPTLNLA